MSVSVIIITKGNERRAQLALLNRSLDRNWPDAERFYVTGSGEQFTRQVRTGLALAGELTCFMCDDGIVYRPHPDDDIHAEDWMRDGAGSEDTLAFSLRLGRNCTVQYPTLIEQEPPADLWYWTEELDNGDFGYPGSIDGDIYRTADLIEALDGQPFDNPTALECLLHETFLRHWHDRKPMMASYMHSVYVGVPVNRVSEQSGVRFGATFDQPAAVLNAMYDEGKRIDLDLLDFSLVNGAHTELDLIGAMR